MGQRRTESKSILCNRHQRRWELDVFKALTHIEGTIVNNLQGMRKRYSLERWAGIESFLSYLLHSLGNDYLF